MTPKKTDKNKKSGKADSKVSKKTTQTSNKKTSKKTTEKKSPKQNQAKTTTLSQKSPAKKSTSVPQKSPVKKSAPVPQKPPAKKTQKPQAKQKDDKKPVKPKKTTKSKNKKSTEQEAASLSKEELALWKDCYNQYKNNKPASYNMKNSYTAQTAINHPTFGWGFIVSVNDNRLEVLFQEGKKKLISNYHG